MTLATPLPSLQVLRENFDYDHDTGVLKWKKRKGPVRVDQIVALHVMNDKQQATKS